MAWTQEQSHRHARCGTFDWQWTDPETGEPVRTWEADIDLCLGCQGLDTVATRLRNANQNTAGQFPALFHVRKNLVEVRADG